MLFNSYAFIFVFFPVSVIVYFALNRMKWIYASKVWLALSSLFFYGYWNVKYVPLILGSILFNYTAGWLLGAVYADKPRQRKLTLIIAISMNLLLLGYYKYAGFFLENLNALLGGHLTIIKLVLPLGISFFTFTQIAYLVDAYKGKAKEYNFVNYVLFVTFYPHLIAGPILHHSEMMPQFDQLRNKLWNWGNASKGAYIFCIGLFKKVVIADTFAEYANTGFAQAFSFVDTWVASLSYTFQLYFDFSGYTDMAIGIALFFNIKLPQNFNSPYKALNIQDFWRRWHMTLSRFLRDYIYIPLGGNRRGTAVAIRNIIITFLLGGLWHGAGWTFILWGLMHGVGQAVHKLWMKVGKPLPKWLAWMITFGFINVTWVFFRAESWGQAVRILKGMFGLQGLTDGGLSILVPPILLILIFVPIVLFTSNSSQRADGYQPNWRVPAVMAVMFVVSLLYLNRITEFLYFNF